MNTHRFHSTRALAVGIGLLTVISFTSRLTAEDVRIEVVNPAKATPKPKGKVDVKTTTTVRKTVVATQAAGTVPVVGELPKNLAVAPVDAPASEPNSLTNRQSSYWLEDYPLNELFAFLARSGGMQYFSNSGIEKIKITGELFKRSSPLEAMKEVGLMNGLLIYRTGNTVYALDQSQLGGLPKKELRYELKYLRLRPPTSQEISPNSKAAAGIVKTAQNVAEDMLKGFLTPGTDKAPGGSVYLEDKVNMLVIVDNEPSLDRIRDHLNAIDRPKRQIAIHTRILNITTAYGKHTGVDWEQTLGAQGMNISATAALNLSSAFGVSNIFSAAALPSATSGGTTAGTGSTVAAGATTGTNTTLPTATTPNTSGSNSYVVLSPVTITAVLHALQDKTAVVTESAPTVITEDNEPALVSLIERTPIVTTTNNTSNGVNTATSEVRYKIDASDPSGGGVEVSRELGTQMQVTPTLLPDGTIRMILKPRVATQVGTVSASSGVAGQPNLYPIVNEATVNAVARVPNGYSLVLGGFSTIVNSNVSNKVPLLGDIPLIGMAFRSKNVTKTRNNTVFIITPTAYEPSNAEISAVVSEREQQFHRIDANAKYPDNEEPGVNADPDFRQSLRSALPVTRTPFEDPTPLDANMTEVPIITPQEAHEKKIQSRYRRAIPVDAQPSVK